jgi:hypothetical protein
MLQNIVVFLTALSILIVLLSSKIHNGDDPAKEGRVCCFLIPFSNSVPLHCVVQEFIKVLHISKYDLELSQSSLLGKLTFGVGKGVMLTLSGL